MSIQLLRWLGINQLHQNESKLAKRRIKPWSVMVMPLSLVLAMPYSVSKTESFIRKTSLGKSKKTSSENEE